MNILVGIAIEYCLSYYAFVFAFNERKNFVCLIRCFLNILMNWMTSCTYVDMQVGRGVLGITYKWCDDDLNAG